MLNIQQHRLHLASLIKTIYKNPFASTCLGFKGGTAAYLLYDLPRFSVDLDFDLLTDVNIDQLKQELDNLFVDYQIKDQYRKRFTLFYLLSYGLNDHNIKVEISTRKNPSKYELAETLGVSVQVMQKASMFAGKLVALTERKTMANRDVFDVNYFANSKWGLDNEVIKFRTSNTIVEQLTHAVDLLKSKEGANMLSGLGELVDNSKKSWVKQNMLEETIELLEGYKFAYK